MAKKIIKDPAGREVWCYGSIHWDSNFDVVCDNECNDILVPGIEDDNGENPTEWQEVINILYKEGNTDMEQVSTC